MEDAARRIVRFFYEGCGDPQTSRRACALVRFYKTCPFGKLDATARSFVEGSGAGAGLGPDSVCLALLGTVGDKPAWNLVESSVGHRAIPLVGEGFVAGLPMIAQLVAQLGIDPMGALRPGPSLLAGERPQRYAVFLVPEAAGSPHVPAQDGFAEPHAIRSVLGLGGLLPSGELYTVILFSTVPIPEHVRELFTTAAHALTRALGRFADATLFT
jgi:hypothetical protein